MAIKDAVTKKYMKDKKVFADAFNYLLYDGQEVITEERLHSIGTELIAVTGEKDAKAVQKQRDLAMHMTAMQDDRQIYLILGIEAQSEVHYGMPVRTMLYDAMQYEEQIKELQRRHKREEDHKQITGGEYLSGMRREDRLVPVITLVIYFGAEPWGGPRRLQEMLMPVEPGLEEYIQDYKINLIVPESLTEKELQKFRSSLREVLEYIKYSKDREKLRKIVKQSERYRNLERDAAAVINAVTRSELKLEEEKEKIDMCKAIDDMRKESFEEGRAEERREMCKAIADMKKESFEEGRAEARREMYKAIADMRKESFEEGRAEERSEMYKAIADMKKESLEQGRVKYKQQTAINMAKMNMNVETIATLIEENKVKIISWLKEAKVPVLEA